MDEDFLNKLLIEQDHRCVLSGIKFDKDNIFSLDRIDSSKGYIKNNVQFVIIEINIMKNNFLESEFIEYCKKIRDFKIINEK